MKISIIETESDYCSADEFARYLVEIAQAVGRRFVAAEVTVVGGFGPRITVVGFSGPYREWRFEDDIRQSVSDIIQDVWEAGDFYVQSDLTQAERDAADAAGAAAWFYDVAFGSADKPFGSGRSKLDALDQIAVKLGVGPDDMRRHGGAVELLGRFESAYLSATLPE